MLIARVVTALVLVAIVILALVYSSAHQLVVIVATVMLLGAWEWAGFVADGRLAVRFGFVSLIAGIFAVLYWWPQAGFGFPLILWLAMGWWVLAFLWLGLRPAMVPVWSVVLGGIGVFVPAWVALSVLQLRTNPVLGPQWLFFLLALIASADVGAYFTGRRFGKTKLAPKVSPGKTWEGFAGGFFLSALVALAGAYWFSVPWLPFLALCAVVVPISVVGDLTESMFKRNAGLKDSGRILPGHGGILDRIDSLTAAAPAFVLGLFTLGQLS